MAHKAGFVNIIGHPNVGKSTLLNALTGENLAVATPKPQTTRHRILGILNGEDYQIVFSDTPGVLKPHYLLQKAMMKNLEPALEDADFFILVADVREDFHEEEVFGRMTATGKPVLLLLNKIDLSDQATVEAKVDFWKQQFPESEILPVSALHHFNISLIISKILEHLPESPPFFPKDELTDRNMRFFISEIIRGKVLEQYQQEIPYSVEVAVDSYKEEDKLVRIGAMIFVARESQKAILLGHRGKAIRRLGTAARLAIEELVGQHVFLDLSVKVLKDWRNDERQLRRFGYEL